MNGKLGGRAYTPVEGIWPLVVFRKLSMRALSSGIKLNRFGWCPLGRRGVVLKSDLERV
jgi:hypothetical protein